MHLELDFNCSYELSGYGQITVIPIPEDLIRSWEFSSDVF